MLLFYADESLSNDAWISLRAGFSRRLSRNLKWWKRKVEKKEGQRNHPHAVDSIHFVGSKLVLFTQPFSDAPSHTTRSGENRSSGHQLQTSSFYRLFLLLPMKTHFHYVVARPPTTLNLIAKQLLLESGFLVSLPFKSRCEAGTASVLTLSATGFM